MSAIGLRSRRRRAVSAVAAAWLVSVGFDFFLHAGLLAKLYSEPHPFLLGPTDAVARIPLGYGAFLVLTVALYWSVRRLDARGAIAGVRLGLTAGAVVWGALVLGLYSISTAPLSLLVGWWFGQSVELALAGGVLGAAAGGASTKRIWALVACGIIALLLGTIAMQTAGFAPAMPRD